MILHNIDLSDCYIISLPEPIWKQINRVPGMYGLSYMQYVWEGIYRESIEFPRQSELVITYLQQLSELELIFTLTKKSRQMPKP